MGKQNVLPCMNAVDSWTTLFIEYLGKYPQTHGSYIINNDPKLTVTFTFDSSEEMSRGFSVGSRYDNVFFKVKLRVLKFITQKEERNKFLKMYKTL